MTCLKSGLAHSILILGIAGSTAAEAFATALGAGGACGLAFCIGAGGAFGGSAAAFAAAFR